jgi:hypothetical protein
MEIRPVFSLNEIVFVTTFSAHEQVLIECPECNGDKFVTVLAGRNPPVTVACENCKAHGLGLEEFSRGTVVQNIARGSVLTAKITGIEIRNDGRVEYRTSKGIFDQSHIFALGSQLAQLSADLMAKEYNDAEAERHTRKHRCDRTWAWNASYHRKEIKEAQRRLEYNTRALSVAARLAKKAKTDENNIA